jgi:hypothetical protein
LWAAALVLSFYGVTQPCRHMLNSATTIHIVVFKKAQTLQLTELLHSIFAGRDHG